MSKKLIILVKSIDGGTGTLAISLFQINKLFPKDSIDIKLIALEKPNYRDVSSYKFNFFRSKNYYPQKYTSVLNNAKDFLEEFFWIKKQISTYKPHVVIGIDIHCNLLILLANFFTFKRPKLILTTHIDLDSTLKEKSSKLNTFVLKKMVKVFYNNADVLICSSKLLSKDLRKNFGLKKLPQTIYDARDLNVAKNPKKFKEKNNKIISTVARLTSQKDYPTLIKAFSLINKEFPKVKLQIISDGPQREMLKKMVDDMGLKESIVFLGWVENIFKFLSSSDLFVFSSKREGFAYVLVEAMSKGLPIVSTNTPFGPSEVLENGKYGLLTKVGNEKQLAKAIKRLLKNKKEYEHYSQISLERSKYFSEEKMLEEYKKIILKLIPNP